MEDYPATRVILKTRHRMKTDKTTTLKTKKMSVSSKINGIKVLALFLVFLLCFPLMSVERQEAIYISFVFMYVLRAKEMLKIPQR